jgi:murein L,D-transpeptidase YafK
VAEDPFTGPPPCPESGDVIVVVTRKRELWLCEQGNPVGKFQVATGRGGFDKRRQGDERTPLGTYTLGPPRASVRYGLFIPIHYPTPEQAAQGFTGGDLGLHGPPRALPEPDFPTTVFDWTRGCIATGLDEHIAVIADFVRHREPTLRIE